MRSLFSTVALGSVVPLLVALTACGEPRETNNAISILTSNVPEPLFEDDPDWGFQIFFEGDVEPEAGGISVEVVDGYGVTYKKLDAEIPAQANDAIVNVSVPMPYVYPNLPAPGPVTVRIWDGADYASSTYRDEVVVTLVARDTVLSFGTAGGGPLTRGARTIIWGVVARIDPEDPRLLYQGFMDIWDVTGATTGDTITVEFGDFNGARNTQHANVYLRDQTTGAFVAEDTTVDSGVDSVLTVPADGDYFVYIVHDPDRFAGVAEYRVLWDR